MADKKKKKDDARCRSARWLFLSCSAPRAWYASANSMRKHYFKGSGVCKGAPPLSGPARCAAHIDIPRTAHRNWI